MKRGWMYVIVVACGGLTGCQSGPWTSWLGHSTHRPSATPAPAEAVKEDSSGAPLVSAQSRIDVMLAAGQSYESEQRFADAINVYEKILKLSPNQPKACHRLAVVHERQGRTDLAEPYYTKALKLAPRNASIHCDYGYSCYLREDLSEAEKHLKIATQLQPNMKRAQANLGLVLAKQGREDESLRAFAEAGLSEAEARNNLAFAMSMNQDLDQAAKQYETAVRLDPNLRQARQSLQELEHVRTRIGPGAPVMQANYESPVQNVRSVFARASDEATR